VTHYKKLVGEKCYLSPCAPEDAEKWAAWENDLEVALPLGDEAYTPSSPERARERITDALQREEHIFSIIDLATEETIGRGMLFGIDLVNRRAMLGIVIGEKAYWGQGYGTDATRLLLEYGFSLLNLNSVMLGVFAFNERAIALYRRVGFREIGRRRQARIIGGRKHDAILMDILAEEFESRKIIP
jgi:RimJ/RimL family protein N-acetyltransferase